MKPMQLSTFLDHAANPLFFEQKKSICFTGPADLEPVLFCSLMREYLKKNGIASTTLDVTANPLAYAYTMLSTSFLGMSACYWLKNITELDAKSRASFVVHLQTYTGPHQILFFMSELGGHAFADSWLVVELPLALEHTLFTRLAACVGKPLSLKSKQMSQRLFARHKVVPLETACVLMQYLTVLGSSDDIITMHFLENLINTQASLFMLSGYFFAKQPENFFKYWKTIASEYQEVFWITFWSEQIWRAHYVVKCMSARQPLDAKKIGFRLPFSFLQRDYKRVSCAELQHAHQFLYEADFQLKNGSSDFCLDLFYVKFLNGDFAISTALRSE